MIVSCMLDCVYCYVHNVSYIVIGLKVINKWLILYDNYSIAYLVELIKRV